jgi:uncharacterized protein YdcH (DUF465 family)
MSKLDALKTQYNQKVSQLFGLSSSDPKYKQICEELNPLDDEIKKLEEQRDAELKVLEQKREAERERRKREEERRVKRWQIEIIKAKSIEFESLYGRPPRISHCHNCKVDLLEFQETICPKCGWMRCYKCGACDRKCNSGLLNDLFSFEPF